MASRVTSNIVGCETFTLCVSNEGQVYSCGTNKHHSLGYSADKPVTIPTVIPSLINIKAVSCGKFHSICLDIDGNVFSFGLNNWNQLGLGKDSTELHHIIEPQKVELPLIRAISCGQFSTICLTDDGFLYSFGRNHHGQLGLGIFNDGFNVPSKIDGLSDIEFVECGGYHVFCKTLNNEIYVWGNNELGELGIKNTKNQHTPVKNINVPNNIVDIKCGCFFTIVLTAQQEVFSCGDNTAGQLGQNNESLQCLSSLKQINSLSNIKRIECGDYHCMCIDNDDILFGFGDNGYGQLGLSDYENRPSPVKLPLNDKEYVSKLLGYPSLSNIIDISSGGSHVFVKTSSNVVFGSGYNRYMQMGVSTNGEFQLSPIRVFEDNEDIWFSNINKSKQKSARF